MDSLSRISSRDKGVSKLDSFLFIDYIHHVALLLLFMAAGGRWLFVRFPYNNSHQYNAVNCPDLLCSAPES